MNLFGFLFLIAASAALLAAPRQWAALPLMAGACYMTLGQGIEVGPFSFTLIRLLILVGILRAFARGERPSGGLLGMDKIMIAWAIWALICPLFREDPVGKLIFHMGRVYTYMGMYFLLRCFCTEWRGVVDQIKLLALVLVPVALEMTFEQVTGKNLFATLGGVPLESAVRNGRLRSQGPFAHAILAGTVGAVCAPMMFGLWFLERRIAITGILACVVIVVTSGSSGPLMSLIFGCTALAFWRWRRFMKQVRWAMVAGYVFLELTMKAPAYFILARIDVTGSSSSYHRAAIIRAGIEHFNEWWAVGTDYTRHWMPYGVSWSPDHADITNHYLAQGVMGGVIMMILFIMIMACGFRYVGQALEKRADAPLAERFFVWSIGASLFAHATTCMSVAYFDQSIFFLYMTFALAATVNAAEVEEEEEPESETDPPGRGHPIAMVAGKMHEEGKI